MGIEETLNNPIIKNGLRVASPELAILVEGILPFFTRKHKPGVAELVGILNRRVATIVKEIAETKNIKLKQEREIRLHEILGIIVEWQKYEHS